MPLFGANLLTLEKFAPIDDKNMKQTILTGGLGIGMMQAVQVVDPAQAVNLVSTIVVAVVTLLRLFKKQKPKN